MDRAILPQRKNNKHAAQKLADNIRFFTKTGPEKAPSVPNSQAKAVG
jgi:hypothetical protein